MGNRKFVGLFLALPLLAFNWSLAHAADAVAATCKDGTTSTAAGRGACSGHGGVQKAAKGKPAAEAPAASPTASAADSAAATCKDGTASTATGRGACSGHGGVQKAAKGKPAAEAPAASSAAASVAPAAAKQSTASKSAPAETASNTDPSGATAKCKDGTYSKSQHHSGSCSKHGGVAEWLTPR
ncbi:MAG: hypothetical protein NVS9B2_05240 [Steroidobacteraceae bacterium]